MVAHHFSGGVDTGPPENLPEFFVRGVQPWIISISLEVLKIYADTLFPSVDMKMIAALNNAVFFYPKGLQSFIGAHVRKSLRSMRTRQDPGEVQYAYIGERPRSPDRWTD